MSFSVETKLVWTGAEALELVDDAVENSSEIAANKVKEIAARIYRGKVSRSASGELIEHLVVKQSKFSDLAYIVGIFAENTFPWEDSVGARSIFFEYGRSAKGKGRRKGQKSQPVGSRAQKPRPFLRPALASVKRLYKGVTAKEIKKALR